MLCECDRVTKCWPGPVGRCFREAVLPLGPARTAALAREGPVEELRIGPLCGRAFLPKRRQRYGSPACQAEANRRKSRERMRSHRRKQGYKRYD